MAPRNENQLQEQLFTWLSTIPVPSASVYLYGYVRDYAFAIPNGVKLAGDPRKRAITAAALKRQGLTPGVSDVFLSLPRRAYHGLYLELKFGDNKPTQQQSDFQARMSHAGYMTIVAYTLDQAKEAIGNYLKL